MPVRRLTIVPTPSTPLVTNGIDRNLAVAPDGTRIVYVGGAGAPKLFVPANITFTFGKCVLNSPNNLVNI